MKSYSLIDGIVYRMNMNKKKIAVYSPIGIVKRVTASLLIGYGVLTLPLPTGSQVAILVGCSLLGISYKVLFRSLWHYSQKALYCFKLLLPSNAERLKYEIALIKMKVIN